MAKENPAALLKQALAHHQAGRLADAEKLCARACALAPGNFDAFLFAGSLALKQRRYADAAARLERACKLNPRSAPAALRFAHALKAQGRLAEARERANVAATLEPKNADAHFCVGELAAALEGFAAAVAPFQRVTELQPGAADGWANLGVALAQSGQAEEALGAFERALAIEPRNEQALTGRALALQQTHRVTEAAAGYAAAIEENPRNFQARSGRLFTLHYGDRVSREALFAEHVGFGAAARDAAKGRTPRSFANAMEEGKRLKIAFLSPDLRAHSVAYFLEPLLAELDRDQFEICLYHDHAREDAMSARLKALANHWRNFAGWIDDRVEAAISADAPDVLIDLAGHTGFNRLPLFARRLAPVQITYLGYPDTTGLAEMDYRFTDDIADPTGEAEAFHTEQLVRFAPTAWCYAPPADAPEPTRIDAGESGVTLGCFNNFSKVSDATLHLWAEVLARVPGSRLLLKSSGLEEPRQQARVRERLARAGIEASRVELLGRVVGLAAHLACYQGVDVALDTFPYHGTTTTCEALWMGVPVVTLAGDRHVSRVSASLLSAIGHPEWIARDAAGYVRIAVELAAAGRRTPEKCHVLRDTLRKSPLLDGVGQAARFGAALQTCWADWCRRRALAA